MSGADGGGGAPDSALLSRDALWRERLSDDEDDEKSLLGGDENSRGLGKAPAFSGDGSEGGAGETGGSGKAEPRAPSPETADRGDCGNPSSDPLLPVCFGGLENRRRRRGPSLGAPGDGGTCESGTCEKSTPPTLRWTTVSALSVLEARDSATPVCACVGAMLSMFFVPFSFCTISA